MYEEAADPAIRSGATSEHRHLMEHRCPFCGGQSLLIGYTDIPEDKYRIEVYCDNPNCVAREMSIIARRTGTRRSQERADVQALHAVEIGTEEEQVADGYELERDEAGKVIGRMIPAGTMIRLDRNTAVLHRRERRANIHVEPDT